jgi:hypothetical protein
MEDEFNKYLSKPMNLKRGKKNKNKFGFGKSPKV